MEKNNIRLHCKECNVRLMDYALSQNDEMIALQGITIKCHRCKRVLVLKKYTEGTIKKHAVNGVFRI